ncbi:MAG: sucrase ferredoxin [Pseudanabaenales cyanobacterium]|nr:sucrase ferredoxin [Pseudanabaenales cyanobacterium]
MSFDFCADQARQRGEDCLGTAPTPSTYVCVECPSPWASQQFESKATPDNLRCWMAEQDFQRQQTKFLLISSHPSQQQSGARILFFEKPSGPARCYQRRETWVADPAQIVNQLQRYFSGEKVGIDTTHSRDRDILICTHGAYDRCCGRYGYPLYRRLLKWASQPKLSHVRLWQASHIGGHRFAPTLVDFPEGRYYGGISLAQSQQLLLRQGPIQDLLVAYRGWGLLPRPLQVAEAAFFRQYGWDWLQLRVEYTLTAKDDQEIIRGALLCHAPDDYCRTYGVEVEVDRIQVCGSCGDQLSAWALKYHLRHQSPPQLIKGKQPQRSRPFMQSAPGSPLDLTQAAKGKPKGKSKGKPHLDRSGL